MKEIKTVDYTETYPKWKDEYKSTHKILIPDMLPWHFAIIEGVLRQLGYDAEILKNDSRTVIDEGLKHVHNDTCFPCLCVIGQHLDALKSGKYDVNKVAVLIPQSGGGCRASNYVPLTRRALKAEFPQVPVISMNFVGLEKDSKIKFGVKGTFKLLYAVFYGDTIMWCYNQTKPYEVEAGSADFVRDEMIKMVIDLMAKNRYKNLKKINRDIITAFAAIKRRKEEKVKVGIVGEIYVKYAALGNNNLEKFLMSEDCEPVVPALMDFLLYCIVNNINDGKFYDKKGFFWYANRFLYNVLYKMQKKVRKLFIEEGSFEPLHDFKHLRECGDKIIFEGVKMGEGWLIGAEMAALAENGVGNIVCTQPFGCLPNHV
ncbi:MAG: 2-hydroxyacyl-CoA dehydratase, partial [Clostridia bacterium]|nr:2-hydroxyacyl-CoA dehydratase [Clostridia bacterium]